MKRQSVAVITRTARETCQVCKKRKKDTCARRVPNADYAGPCGDSFCYHSCDMDSCKTREFDVIACGECAKKLATLAKGPAK